MKWVLIIILMSEWNGLTPATKEQVKDRLEAAIDGVGDKRDTGTLYWNATSNNVAVICPSVRQLDLSKSQGIALRNALTNLMPSTVVRIDDSPGAWMHAHGYMEKPKP